MAPHASRTGGLSSAGAARRRARPPPKSKLNFLATRKKPFEASSEPDDGPNEIQLPTDSGEPRTSHTGLGCVLRLHYCIRTQAGPQTDAPSSVPSATEHHSMRCSRVCTDSKRAAQSPVPNPSAACDPRQTPHSSNGPSSPASPCSARRTPRGVVFATCGIQYPDATAHHAQCVPPWCW